MNKFFLILALILAFSAFEFSRGQTPEPECPDEYYFNSTCNKCVRCQWDVIDPPNDATHHWCECNCYTVGQFNLRTDLCFLQGMIWAPPPTGHQECQWRCKGKESTSKNGTFPSTEAYLARCNTPIPQCHPTCYHCLPGIASANTCTECPVGYKLDAFPAGRCIKDYDNVTNTGKCGGDPSCADFTCPNNLVKLEGVDHLPGQTQYCCGDPLTQIFVCGLYVGECPAGYVQNPATYWSELPFDQMTVDNCCIKTCGSSAFSCNSGYVKKADTLSQYPASNSLCCQPTCSLYNCPAGYNLKNPSSTTMTQANCCEQTCVAFTCLTGYVHNQANSASTILTNSNCCLPTCSIYNCPAGYNVIHPTSTTMTQDNCCEKTCAAFTCLTGYVLNPANTGSTILTNTNCCLPTCSIYNCPAGYNVIHPTSTTMTQDNCCEKTCAAFTCLTGYVLNPANTGSTILTNTNCCLPTCSIYNCPAGYNVIHPTSTTMTQDNCCENTCAVFSCLTGYVLNPANTGSTILTNTNCCLPTCSIYNCPAGYNVIHPTSTTMTQDNCCQNTCAVFSCLTGYVLNPANSASTTLTNSNCCLPTCTVYNCPAGYSIIHPTSTTMTQDNCCYLIPTCGNSFTCPAGYSSINFSSTTINLATCCQQLCGATSFSCNAGYALDQTKLNSIASQSNCCLPTCATFTCPEGYITNFDNQDSYPASTSLCCTVVVQTFTCLSVLGTCQGTDVMVDPTAEYVSYSQCCQPTSCPPDQYMLNGTCVPCQWDIINPPNDATYNWCRCNCYTPGTTVVNSGVCWIFGNGPQKPPIQECKWVCTGNEAKSSNGTMALNQWVDTCILTPQCDSNCYTCSKTNSKQCTSCLYPQVLTNGKCICPNGKASHYGVC